MTRALAVVCALTLVGCADARAADAHFEGLTTRELPVRVLVTNFGGESADVALLVDVSAPSASWASLVATELPSCISGGFSCRLSLTGPARRMAAGRAELELRDHVEPTRCSSGTCELDYVVRLDTTPTEPWDVVISATVDGHTREGASVLVGMR